MPTDPSSHRSSRLLALAGALLLAVCVRAAANARSTPEPTPPPVLVKTCELREKGGTVPPKGLHLVFVNNRGVPITSVDFQVKYGGESQDTTVDGSFTHGAVIDRSINLFERFSFTGAQTQACRVTQINYSDGSVVSP